MRKNLLKCFKTMSSGPPCRLPDTNQAQFCSFIFHFQLKLKNYDKEEIRKVISNLTFYQMHSKSNSIFSFQRKTVLRSGKHTSQFRRNACPFVDRSFSIQFGVQQFPRKHVSWSWSFRARSWPPHRVCLLKLSTWKFTEKNIQNLENLDIYRSIVDNWTDIATFFRINRYKVWKFFE